MVYTRQIYDSETNVIRVDSPNAKLAGKFGTSLLYKYGSYNFHPRAIEVLDNVHRLRFRQDDIILSMFPKSGSTWLSECIYLIVHQYMYELASKESIEFRFPQIDSPSHDVFELILDQYSSLNEPRLIKASIPPNLLVAAPVEMPSSVRPRVISILRNPRDVLVSFYHHSKTVKHYDVDFTFDEFFNTFVSGKVPCGPIWLMYNDTMQYHRENPNSTMVIKYEDMKRDLRDQIRRVCRFLNKAEPGNEDRWAELLDHLSVERMRENRTINRHDWTQLGLRNADGFEFVRKGQVNDWKNFFTAEQSSIFDREITEKLAPELRLMYPPQVY